MVKTSFMKPLLLALIAVVGTSDLAMGREEKYKGHAPRGRKVEEDRVIKTTMARGLKGGTVGGMGTPLKAGMR